MKNLYINDVHDAKRISCLTAMCSSTADLLNVALPKLQRSLGASSSVFMQAVKSEGGGLFQGLSVHGTSRRDLALWNKRYQSLDPVVNHYLNESRPKDRHVVISSEIMRPDEFMQTEFYNSFLEPLSIHHVMLVGLTDSSNAPIALMGFHRPRGTVSFSNSDTALAKLVSSHFSAIFQRCQIERQIDEQSKLINYLLRNSAHTSIALLNQDLDPILVSRKMQSLFRSRSRKRSGNKGNNDAELVIFSRSARMLDDVNAGDTEIGSRSVVDIDTSFGKQRVTLVVTSNCCNEKYVIITMRDAGMTRKAEDRLGQSNLTNREREVVRLVVTGRKNAEIADQLRIKIRTVENHLHAIYSKLGVNNRTSLACLYGTAKHGFG